MANQPKQVLDGLETVAIRDLARRAEEILTSITANGSCKVLIRYNVPVAVIIPINLYAKLLEIEQKPQQ